MTLFDLAAKIGLDSSEFEKGIDNAERSGKSLGEKLSSSFDKIKKAAAIALSGAVIKKGIDTIMDLANATSAAGDKIDKQSQALGLSRKAYQEWDYILGQNGASIDSLGVSMKTLNSLVLDAAAGGKESKIAFSKLGVSIHELETMSMEDQFEAVVRAFQRMPEGAKKSALAVQIFGRNGMELLPLLNQSETSIDELRKRAEELGIIMSDDAVDASVAYNDAMDDLNRTFNGLKYSLGAKLLPTFTTGINKMTSYVGKLNKAFQKKGLKGVWDTLVADFKNIKWPTWADVRNAAVTAWNTVVDGVKGLAKLVFGTKADGSVNWPTWSDVEEAAKTAWKTIQDGASQIADIAGGLIFGRKKDGSVDWPTWKDVLTKAKEAWSDIKTNAKAIADTAGAIVFGRKEDGTVDWPTWSQVSAKATEIWNDIKEKALDMAGLVFGRKEDGTVDWPTWADVETAATNAWNKIKSKALDLAGLVFGRKEDGSVDFPTWAEVKAKATEVWNSIKTKARDLAGLVFGRKKDGSVDWPTWSEVSKKATEVWNSIKEKAKNLAGLVFGRKKDGTVAWPTWAEVSAKATEAWNTIKAKALNLAGLVFGKKKDGTVNWPTWSDVEKAATAAWNAIKAGAKKLAGLVFGKKEDGTVDWPTWEDVKTAATTAWDAIKAEAAKLKGLVFGDAADAGSIFNSIKESFIALHDTIEEKAINIASYFFGESDPATVSSAIQTVGSALDAIGVAVVTYFTVTKLRGIINFFKNFKSIFTAAVGGNKLGLILAGIAAAITLIIENWDKIEPVISEVGTWLQDNLISPINDFIDSIKQAIKAIGAFLGIDTSGWFGGDGIPLPSEMKEFKTSDKYSTAHLDDSQIQSLIAMRQLIKDNPGALFTGSDGVTREGSAAFKKTFEDTMRAAGFDDTVIQKFSDGIANLSDSGFADLMTTLRNAEGFYDESGNKISGMGDNAQTAAVRVNTLGSAASNAASELNSIQAPDLSGIPGHAKGLWDVPHDNYLARLHRGETVLTESRAREYREGGSNNVDVNALVTAMVESIRSSLQGVTVKSYLSGRDVTDDVNRNTVRQLKARRFAT